MYTLKFFVFKIIFVTSVYAFDLALDIGHTPLKAGATSSQCVNEYQYNKSLGSYIEAELPKQNSNIKIFTNNTQEVSFTQRYKLSENKDLFISLHHDSVQEIYIKKTQDGCPSSGHASGYSLFISRKNPYFKESLSYAQKFATALKEQGLKPSLHHAEKIKGENRELLDPTLGIYVFDDLKVLKNTQSPAILFEAGVLVNPIDEQAVRTTLYKLKILNAFLALTK